MRHLFLDCQRKISRLFRLLSKDETPTALRLAKDITTVYSYKLRTSGQRRLYIKGGHHNGC